ncbi:alpha/beta fold hydrolase [Streptomyces genisteinicus]|uniref:Alpha/beta fold hydrolase n=1 Tax=Streptomyces genisteinicus TaxID=2768068 RepID=A0A7H0HY29_9ACTN|nr:alpha/beta fold hydrolase [Streptomyces genisteinicus]QNP65445.1 alpha/beta fold hydrolase [Streptomyces genisteinicus]
MDNLSSTASLTMSTDGTAIACEQRGTGPAVVLVGGALCTSASDAPLAELLAADFTVFTYDRRGRGGSGDRAPYAVEREIEDLAAVVALAGGEVMVHGMSSGAALALRAAAAGVPVRGLSVYEPPYETGARARADRRARVHRMASLLAEDRRGDVLAEFLRAAGMPAEALYGLRRLPVWADMERLAHTLAYDHEVLGDGTVPTELLATVTGRVLVVDGGASPSPMREAARAVATALPRGRHRTLTGQTHEVAPHVLAPVLAAFFAG